MLLYTESKQVLNKSHSVFSSESYPSEAGLGTRGGVVTNCDAVTLPRGGIILCVPGCRAVTEVRAVACWPRGAPLKPAVGITVLLETAVGLS